MRIWSFLLGLLGNLGTWNNFPKVNCALAPSRAKRSYENGYYFYIPADRGCFDQLPACPKFTCEHEQLRPLCALSCGDCTPSKDGNDKSEDVDELVELFQSFFNSWPSSKKPAVMTLGGIPENSFVEREKSEDGHENGIFGISQPFCGNRKQAEKNRRRRITNGEQTDPGQHPWIVAIAYKKRVGCGGTIMTASFIITAAHCVGGEPRDSIVIAGVHNLDHLARQNPKKVDPNVLDRIQARGVTNYYSHPEYDTMSDEHDIAVLELDDALIFSDYVQPACLPTREPVPKAICEVAGWGSQEATEKPVVDDIYDPLSAVQDILPDFVKIPDYTRRGRDTSGANVLKKGDLEIINLVECKKAYKGDLLTNDMFCAGSDFGVDTCLGDSGGPLVCEDPYTGLWEISGVTSWGRGCGVAKFPGVYTKVVNYLGWLEMIATGRGRPSRVKHMQDDDYEIYDEYEASADYDYASDMQYDSIYNGKSTPSENEVLNAFFNEEADIKDENIPDDWFDNSVCREVLTEFQGEIFTPGFRKQKPQYPPNLDCQWEILAPPNYHIELEFVKFKLEYHRNCRMDRVEIHHDGQGFFLCGSGTPGKKFISEGPSLKIIFTTDEDRNQLGFEARYRIVQNTKTVLLEDIAQKSVQLETKDLEPPAPRSLLPMEQLENMHEMCGNPITSPGHERRIWGGGPITNQQWPWLGMLLEEDGNYIHMKCGVALICNKWVVTSGDCAHELKLGPKYEHSIKFGNLRWDIDNVEEQTIKVDEIVVHPDFDGGYHSDIALIKLKKNVDFSKYIRPICIQNIPVHPGPMDCYAAGWGKTRTADSTRQAHQTAITLISNETCENVYNIKYSKEEMVCTGGMNRPCQGDGGAPLICQSMTGEWFLHGISIYGPGCGRRNNNGPSVFVRPGAFIDFIRTVTGDCLNSHT